MFHIVNSVTIIAIEDFTNSSVYQIINVFLLFIKSADLLHVLYTSVKRFWKESFLYKQIARQ